MGVGEVNKQEPSMTKREWFSWYGLQFVLLTIFIGGLFIIEPISATVILAIFVILVAVSLIV
jgi:hypothetical protein